MGLARASKEAAMSRYYKRPRPAPTSEEFLVLVILLGPLAWPIRWLWRCLKGLSASTAS